MPVSLRPARHPRVVLLDCSENVEELVSSMGIDYEVAASGYFLDRPKQIPTNLHEKDLLIVDLEPGWEPLPADEAFPIDDRDPFEISPRADHAREGRRLGKDLKRFEISFARGGAVIVLMEGTRPLPAGKPMFGTRRGWELNWLPGAGASSPMGIYTASPQTRDDQPDDAIHIDEDFAAADPDEEPVATELVALLESQPDLIARRTLAKCRPLLVNDAYEYKAGFLQVDSGIVLFLPYFRRKPAAVRRLLTRVLPAFSPALFPIPDSNAWPGLDEFQMPQVQQLRKRRSEAIAEHERALEVLAQAEQHATVEQRPHTELLTAQGDDLKDRVAAAFEFLGFDVEDTDTQRLAAGLDLEEDLALKDGDWFAVVDVTSSKSNVKDSHFSDVQKYMHRRTRDPRRDDIDPTRIAGLLVANQFCNERPDRRPALFETNPRTSRQASESDVGLLSSWDLFQLVRRVAAGDVDMAAARATIRQPGLIVAG